MKIKKTFKVDVEIGTPAGVLLVLAWIVIMACLYMGVEKAVEEATERAEASIKKASETVKAVDGKLPVSKRIIPFNWEIELRGSIHQIVVKKNGVIVDSRQSDSVKERLSGTGIFDDVYLVMSAEPVTIAPNLKQEK